MDSERLHRQWSSRGRMRLFAGALPWVVVILVIAAGARADDRHARAPVVLLTTIPVPGLTVFDISWIDSRTGLDYISDRSNNAIDVIDTRRNVLVKQIQKGGFRGFSGDNDTSGPNGVTVSGHLLFTTDARSRVVSIDLRTDQVVGEVRTGGEGDNRADELAFDPDDSVILAINNVDEPPFGTLIKVDDRTGALTVQQRITFESFGPRADTATNEVEMVAYDHATHRFFVSVPEVNGPGGTGTEGVVAVIDPRSGAVDQVFPVTGCQGAGITIGPDDDLLLGCSVTFDTAGEACEEPSATAAIDCHGRSASPKHVNVNKRTGRTHDVPGVVGSDEVWFNPGDRRYYTASRDNAAGPVLGVIDADRRVVRQLVPTFNTPLTAPKPQGGAKSVAVDPSNNHAFVPLPPGNVFPSCLAGCVAVFGSPDD
jgi:hypothetical protein